MNKLKTKDLTLSALLIALTLVILALNSILPISTLSILTLASVMIPVAIMRTSIKNAFMIYIASTLLGFLVLPKDIIILYGLFFGIYGLVKFYIEKLNNLYLEISLKLLFAFMILIIYYFITKSFVSINLNVEMPIYFIIVLTLIIFLIYDYALTVLISYYLRKLHNRI